jgi:hypothetical protein
MIAAPRLRPMTIGDLFDISFRLYRENFLTFIGIAALLQIPFTIVQALVQFLLGGPALSAINNLASAPPGRNPLEFLPIGQIVAYYGLTFGLSVFQFLVIYNLMIGALSKAISRSYLGQPISIINSYQFGGRRYAALLLVSLIIFGITSLLGLIFFVLYIGAIFALIAGAGSGSGAAALITGIAVIIMVLLLLALFFVGLAYVYTRFLFSTQAIILEENVGALASIRRSWQLVKGSFWRALGVVVLMGILVYIIAALPATLLTMFLTFTSAGSVVDYGRNQAIGIIVAQLGQIIALPLQFAVYTLLYYDMRVRKEGYDLEIMARQVIGDQGSGIRDQG